MSKFKVGELIRCVDASQASGLTVGTVYQVLNLDEENDPYVESDCGSSYPYASFRFELAESEKEQPKPEPTVLERVTSRIERSTLIYSYLDTKDAFERAMAAYNEACQAIRDKLKDGERFVYTRYSEAYIVQRDKDGFTVERIDMV